MLFLFVNDFTSVIFIDIVFIGNLADILFFFISLPFPKLDFFMK